MISHVIPIWILAERIILYSTASFFLSSTTYSGPFPTPLPFLFEEREGGRESPSFFLHLLLGARPQVSLFSVFSRRRKRGAKSPPILRRCQSVRRGELRQTRVSPFSLCYLISCPLFLGREFSLPFKRRPF